MTILAFYSNKGGVGKTATAVNIAHIAAKAGIKTLIWDLDPQSAATYYFRIKPKLKIGTKSFLQGKKMLNKNIKGTDYENLDLLPADFSNRDLDISFNEVKGSRHRIGRILKPLKKEFDLFILDCPCTINILAENIFNATDYIFVPSIPTSLSARAYKQLVSFFRKNNYDVNKLFAFFSMVDSRKKMHKDFMIVMQKEFQQVLYTYIPYFAIIEKMGIIRKPVSSFAPNSLGAKAYINLWDEVLEKITI